ncbi:MAG: hypothetical protein RLZ95_1252 [Bacteroidota bacterium]|jgi:hypothetical protein
MKKILFLITFSVLMFSCGLSKEELTKEVQKSMEAEWKKNPDIIIKVRSFSLIKKSDSEYSGLLETDESDKETPTVKVEGKYNVEVVTDGKEFKWEIKQ